MLCRFGGKDIWLPGRAVIQGEKTGSYLRNCVCDVIGLSNEDKGQAQAGQIANAVDTVAFHKRIC